MCHAAASSLVLLGIAAVSSALAAVPTLDELAGQWIELDAPPSANFPVEQLDMPVIQNFYGSVGLG